MFRENQKTNRKEFKALVCDGTRRRKRQNTPAWDCFWTESSRTYKTTMGLRYSIRRKILFFTNSELHYKVYVKGRRKTSMVYGKSIYKCWYWTWIRFRKQNKKQISRKRHRRQIPSSQRTDDGHAKILQQIIVTGKQIGRAHV